MKTDSDIALSHSPRPEHLTVSQWVYRELRQAILVGNVPPGRAMTIRALARVMGVSSMPVREALGRLVSEHALVVPDNRRAHVPEMTASKFEELVGTRVALETLAAQRAMSGIDANRLEILRNIDQRPLHEIRSADAADNILRNYCFHRTLYESVPSPVLMPLIESVWLQLGPFMRLAMAHICDHYPPNRHNEAIEAIVRGDLIALRIAIEADIRDGVGHIGRAELIESYARAAKSNDV